MKDEEEAKKGLVFTTDNKVTKAKDNQDDIQEDDVQKEDANENQDEEDMEHSYKEAHTKDETNFVDNSEYLSLEFTQKILIWLRAEDISFLQ